MNSAGDTGKFRVGQYASGARPRQTGGAALHSGGEIAELVEAVDALMNGWCDRKAIKPLQILLRAYPGPLWHAYHRMELLETLEALIASPGELTDAERETISKLVELLKDRPFSAGAEQQG